MKLICERDALNRALSFVGSRARSKLKIPILANVKIETEHNGIHLTTTDLETKAEASCSAEIAMKGATTLTAERLGKIVELMPTGAQVSMELIGQELQVQSGRSRYKLPVLPVEDFPEMSEPSDAVEFTLPCLDVRALFGEPVPGLSVGEGRKMLEGGLLYQPESGQIAVWGCNGKKFVRRAIPLNVQFDDRYIVPRSAMAEIVRIASEGDIGFRCGKNLIEVKAGGRSFTSKLIDETYPDVDKIIPPRMGQFLLVDRTEFTTALKRLSGLTNDNSSVDLTWRGNDGLLDMTLSGEGQGSEQVACECDIPAGTISFAPALIGPLIDSFKGDVLQLHVIGAQKAMHIVDPADDGLTVLAMPCLPYGARVRDAEAA